MLDKHLKICGEASETSLIQEAKAQWMWESLKRHLLALVDDLAKISWLFSVNPSSDFIRHRKLDFATVIRILLSMQSGCLRSELQEFFRFSAACPSASAFVQQRNKLLPDALAFLFRAFNEQFPRRKTYKGYHLLACDGSDLNIARNPSDADTYFQYSSANRGFNQLHLNVLFDLCEKRYIDAIVQPALRENETPAMIRMAERYSGLRVRLHKSPPVRLSTERNQEALYGATPHTFRHSYISALVEAGVDLKTVQQISGHANVMTTMNIYTHTRTSRVQEAGQNHFISFCIKVALRQPAPALE